MVEEHDFPCGRWAWIDRKTGDLSAFKCGKATCSSIECKKLFWHRRVKLIQSLVEEHRLNKFFTLTLCHESVDLEPWCYVHHVWSKFRKRMNRKFIDFKFVSVLEAHKDTTWPHVHGFTNVWMEKKEWSSMWESCGGGKITWIESVKDKEISEYVGKELSVYRYVGKEQLSGAVARNKGKRTLWRSKGLKAGFELEKSDRYVIIKQEIFDSKGIQHLEIESHGKEAVRLAKARRSISKESNSSSKEKL